MPTAFLFKTAPGRDPGQAALGLDLSFALQGLQTQVVGEGLRNVQTVRGLLNYLLEGFIGMGLVSGMAALGVISTRAVVERRQDARCRAARSDVDRKGGPMKRRDALQMGGVCAALAATLRAPRAGADTRKGGAGVLSISDYLARAALLLDETRRAQDWIGYHPSDVGLAALALEIAEARSAAAARIAAPATVKQAHMHLLLALENTTASFDATVRGDGKRAAQRMANARAEEQTLHLALEGVKLKVPAVK